MALSVNRGEQCLFVLMCNRCRTHKPSYFIKTSSWGFFNYVDCVVRCVSHFNDVFKEGGLERNSIVAKYATVASDGKTYQIESFNLDVIISAGYRVKLLQGRQFRQWVINA